MKSFLKDFNDNFWKYMVVIILIIMLVFSIKWTNCLCSLSDAAVKYFDRNGPYEHFNFDILKEDSIKQINSTKEATKNKLDSTEEDTETRIKSAQVAAENKLKSTEEDTENKLNSTEEDAKTHSAQLARTENIESTKANIQNIQNQQENISQNLSSEQTKLMIKASEKRQQLETEKDMATKKLKTQLESFTSKIRTCEIKSPNNIVAGYMNSIDHDINNACNHPNPNDCSLVKSSITGGVQYIESKSLRKSNGEFSGVTEWTKQTA